MVDALADANGLRNGIGAGISHICSMEQWGDGPHLPDA
jgi:hypothetical protein